MATTREELQGYEPLARRAGWAKWVLVAAIALDVIAVGSDLAQVRLLGKLDAGDLVSDQALEANDVRQAAIGIAQTVVFIVAAVFFLRWFRRAYDNLLGLGAKELRFGPGWAIGAWFVPILNLFRPKQIANDIWRASDPAAPAEQGTDWKERPLPGLYGLWWGLFVVSGFAYFGASRLNAAADTVAQLQIATWNYVAADALTAAAGICAFLVVKRTTERQEARAARLVA